MLRFGFSRLTSDRAWMGFILLASALFLFVDAKTSPIVLWDESRNIVNALEMRRSGLSLVTTYGFAPDLWNTKPPLLIWLMTASMAIFGPFEWAMRLPSAIAALGTMLLVMLFVRRVTNSMPTAALAAVLLVLSPGFFGEHGARTADYDALLTFFTTAYTLLLFFSLHRQIPGTRPLLLAGLLIALAVLTKSIAGLIPGTGIVLYLLLTGRLGRLRAMAPYGLMTLAAIIPVLSFYAAREAMLPGYADAALHNDLVGRFQELLVERQRPPWVYVQELIAGWCMAGPFLFTIPIAFGKARGKSRAALLFSLCIAGVILTVISLSATRLIHYSLPAFPFLAIATAIAFQIIFRRIVTDQLRNIATLAGIVLLTFFTVRAFEWRYEYFPRRQYYAQALYGELFQSLSRQGISRITVRDEGFPEAGETHYAPLLRAYQLLWQERGLTVNRQMKGDPSSATTIVASCDPPNVQRLLKDGSDVGGIIGCAAIKKD